MRNEVMTAAFAAHDAALRPAMTALRAYDGCGAAGAS
jgi:hypothetical protein